MVPVQTNRGMTMTKLNNEICELNPDELDAVSGGMIAEYFAGLVAAAATKAAGGGFSGGGGAGDPGEICRRCIF
jgi:hypothetical protein